MIDQIQAKARVQLLVEINVDQPWGGSCQISQLYEQASASALSALSNALKPGVHGITIIGEPNVLGIITEKRRPIHSDGMGG